MSISTELSRIQADKNTIRAKLVELGMATNTDNLDKLAAAIEGLVNQGAVSVEVIEGTTYTIPAGYHNGSGTVKAISDVTGDAESYKTQAKTVTPTKQQQSVTPDSGYYALSSVTVSPIPEAYQDVSSVTALAEDVLTGKMFVASDGKVLTGTMTNNGKVSKTLDVTTVSYTIPKGYHSGTGTVTISVEKKTVTPTKSVQTISPTKGKVLSEVTVNPIPDEYIITDDATASESQILNGETAYVSGSKLTGSMPNNGAVSKTLDATTGNQTYTVPEGYHDGTGTVKIVTETKSTIPSKTTQQITPTSGKVLSSVSIAPIPSQYQDVTPVTALAAEVLAGKKIVDASGEVVEGTMPNNGEIEATIDGLTTTAYAIEAGYTSGGTVSLTTDIEEALAAI